MNFYKQLSLLLFYLVSCNIPIGLNQEYASAVRFFNASDNLIPINKALKIKQVTKIKYVWAINK